MYLSLNRDEQKMHQTCRKVLLSGFSWGDKQWEAQVCKKHISPPGGAHHDHGNSRQRPTLKWNSLKNVCMHDSKYVFNKITRICVCVCSLTVMMTSVRCVKMEESWFVAMDVLEPFTCPASALHSAPYPGSNMIWTFWCFNVCLWAYGGTRLQCITVFFVCFQSAVALGSVSGAVGREWKESRSNFLYR